MKLLLELYVLMSILVHGLMSVFFPLKVTIFKSMKIISLAFSFAEHSITKYSLIHSHNEYITLFSYTHCCSSLGYKWSISMTGGKLKNRDIAAL